MKANKSGQTKAARQCWECLKRRLVCDHTLPHCNKCQKTGKDCPGYDEQKPLQWIETGKVTSRRRKKDNPPTIYTIPTRQKDQVSVEAAEVALDSPLTLFINENLQEVTANAPINYDDDGTTIKLVDWERALTIWNPLGEQQWGYLAENRRVEVMRELAVQQAAVLGHVNRIFRGGGRAKMEAIVARGSHEEAAKALQSQREPLKRLERLLWFMRSHDLPDYDYLSNETSEVVQAVQYYNVRIHPDILASGELAPNPVIVTFPLLALHVLPPTVHHTLVCLSLNHFVHSLPAGTDKRIIISNRSKVYHHRGAAIRALSHYVSQDKTRCSDVTIASILIFMSVELQDSAFAEWRSHASGMQRLIDMRGGLKSLMGQAPYLVPTLVIYVLIVSMANTCSPSWDQIDISANSGQTIDDIANFYSLMFPYTLCPPVLFLDLLRINELRLKVSTAMMLCEINEDHTLQAHDLLARIEAFVPEDWAQPQTYYDEWVLIGIMYQAAVAVHCTMAFQSLTVLPNTLEMNSMRSIHGDHLLSSLRKGLKSPRLTRFILWPLVVAGVEAAYRGEGTRNFIESALTDLAGTLGSSSPLKARAVLRRYWQKEEPGWDECFDRPYVFVV